MITFSSNTHKRYLYMIVNQCIPCGDSDSARLTLAYFAIAGLDLLNGLDKIEDKKGGFIEWIYHLQSRVVNVAGFENSASFHNELQYRWGNLAATYSALNMLLILGDDLSRVDKKGIVESMKLLQLDDGSFTGSIKGVENDMRFVYCAACISYILDDWSGINVEKAVTYILNSISYDGGIGQGPNLESHGGSTYCAVATLALTSQLHRLTAQQKHKLIRWIVNLQVEGFQGRPNKTEDSCYTYWLGASLKILDAYNLINKERLKNFVLSSQDFIVGGLSKWSGYHSDPLHTYLGLAGLSFLTKDDLSEVIPTLNITKSAFEHLKRLHTQKGGIIKMKNSRDSS